MTPVAFTVQKEDVLALIDEYSRRTPSLNSAREKARANYLAWVFMFVVAGFACLMSGGHSRVVGLLFLVFAAYAAFGYRRWCRTGVADYVGAALSDVSYQKTFGRYTIAVGEDGVMTTSPVAEARFTWRAIDRVCLTPTHLLIFLTASHGLPIRRGEVPESAILELKAFVESHAHDMQVDPPPAVASGKPCAYCGAMNDEIAATCASCGTSMQAAAK